MGEFKTPSLAKRIRGYAIELAINATIVIGYLKWPGNRIYGNFLVLYQWWCWLAGLLCLFGAFAFAYMASRVSTQSNPDHTVKSLFWMKKMRISPWRRFYRFFIELPVVLFAGVVMGHWALFAAMLFEFLASAWAVSAAAEAYDKIPKAAKGADTDGDGVPDMEKQIEREAANPITKVIEDRKAKAAAKQQAVDSLAERIAGGDDEE